MEPNKSEQIKDSELLKEPENIRPFPFFSLLIRLTICVFIFAFLFSLHPNISVRIAPVFGGILIALVGPLFKSVFDPGARKGGLDDWLGHHKKLRGALFVFVILYIICAGPFAYIECKYSWNHHSAPSTYKVLGVVLLPHIVLRDLSETYEEYLDWWVDKGENSHSLSLKVTQVTTGNAYEPIDLIKFIDLGNGVTMEFVLIPAGSFNMGSPDSEEERDSDEGPIRRVQISKSFYMGKFEVTQAQYQAVMGSNPSKFKGDNLPVEQVSWNDTTEFCRKLSQKEGKTYRLPTDAEWEYACRAGSETRFYYGDDPQYSGLGEYAWYTENSNSTTHSVGQKKPNAWGLYDMSGNVLEWCSDRYVDSLRNLSTVDPSGPASGQYRVIRGGSWNLNTSYCRSASRSRSEPTRWEYSYGFRVVLNLN